MNKLLAILFLLGTIAGFGLAMRNSYQVQDQSIHGAPIGQPRTVYVGKADRIFYVGFGFANMLASLYFIARVRQSDLRK
jgi:hypothetical protein